MPTVITVCLPGTVAVAELAATAIRIYRSTPHPTAQAAPTPHFAVRGRRHHRRLLQPHHDTAAGGPLSLIDFATMSRIGQEANWRRWHIWNQAVHGTRAAQPYWRFVERTRTDHRYTLYRARQDYLAQPRIAVMTQHNLTAHRGVTLPTSHLEALQTNAATYTRLGGMTAVHGHGLVTATGALITAASADRLTDIHDFLSRARHAIRALSRGDILVALACG